MKTTALRSFLVNFNGKVMQKIETEYHYITSSENEAPKYICKGKCKKAYWENDYREASPLEIIKCSSCNGNVGAITKNEYKVIEFKITPQHTRQVTIGYVSQVKPEFVEYAKAHWAK
jgi:NAD-dependent SIR2 family protein deacetylase